MKEFIEKLIGRLEEYQDKYAFIKSEDDYALGEFNACEYAINTINELAEEHNNGWIPCSERLPEDRKWCLAVFQEGDSDFVLVPRVANYIGRETVCTTNEGWLIIDMEDEIGINAYYKNLKCIAWQPLPLPYKAGD